MALTPTILLIWFALVLTNFIGTHPQVIDFNIYLSAFNPMSIHDGMPFLTKRATSLLLNGSYLVLIFLLLSAVGHRIGLWLKVTRYVLFSKTIRCCFGIGVMGLAWFSLGLLGLWYGYISLVGLVVGAFSLPRIVLHIRRSTGIAKFLNLRMIVAVMVLAPAFLMTFAGAAAPETGFDPLKYHLELSQRYIQEHKIYHGGMYAFENFPLNASMLFGYLKLIGGDELAKMFNWALLLMLLNLCFALTGFKTNRSLVWMVLLGVPLVWIHASHAYAGMLLAVFVSCGALFLVEATGAGGIPLKKCAMLSGVFIGFALGVKYQAAQAAVPLALCWLWLSVKRSALQKTTVICFGTPVLLLWGPWLLKNVLLEWNPFHPFFGQYIPSLDISSPLLNPTKVADVLGNDEWLNVLAAPWTLVMADHEINAFPRGPLLLVALSLLCFSTSKRARMLAVFVLGFFTVWAWTTFGWGRFILPILVPLMSLLLINWVELLHWFSPTNKVIHWCMFGLTVTVGHALGVVALFYLQNPLPHLVGAEDPKRYISKRLTEHNIRCLTELGRHLKTRDRFYSYGNLIPYYSTRASITDDGAGVDSILHIIVKQCFDAKEIKKKFQQLRIYGMLHNMRVGITMSRQYDVSLWKPQEVRLYQKFVRQYIQPIFRLEDQLTGDHTTYYAITRTEARPGRLYHGKIWPHLPGLEGILFPGDKEHSLGNLRRALLLYQKAQKEYPDYAWVYQRISEVAKELGLIVEANAALVKKNTLAGIAE